MKSGKGCSPRHSGLVSGHLQATPLAVPSGCKLNTAGVWRRLSLLSWGFPPHQVCSCLGSWSWLRPCQWQDLASLSLPFLVCKVGTTEAPFFLSFFLSSRINEMTCLEAFHKAKKLLLIPKARHPKVAAPFIWPHLGPVTRPLASISPHFCPWRDCPQDPGPSPKF